MLKQYFALCRDTDIPLQINSSIQAFRCPMLFTASQMGHTEIVKYLLEHGAFDQVDDFGLTALAVACEKGHILIAELLLAKTARYINTANQSGFTPLHAACNNQDAVFVRRNGKHKTIISLLLENGANINAITSLKVTPLHAACTSGCAIFIQELIEHAKERNVLPDIINALTESGLTPLGLVIIHQNIEPIQLLLDNGANVELCGENNDQTPFITNCYYDNPEIGQLLLDHGANLDTRKSNGFTPLHTACQEGNIKMVKFLLGKNVDVNTTTVKKNTPLHLACSGKHHQIVKILLDHGARINSPNDNHTTPLWYSCLEGDINSVYELIKHGADQTLVGNYLDENDEDKKLTPREVALELKLFSLANFITALNNNDNSIYVCPTDRCSICFEDCEDGSLGIIFSCGHALHASCAQPYTNLNCPLCRAKTNIDCEDITTCKKVIIFTSHIPAQSNENKRKREDIAVSDKDGSEEEIQQSDSKRQSVQTHQNI